MMNLASCKYALQWLMAMRIARYSLSYVDKPLVLGPRALLMKAKG
jgi:hypothetical protein